MRQADSVSIHRVTYPEVIKLKWNLILNSIPGAVEGMNALSKQYDQPSECLGMWKAQNGLKVMLSLDYTHHGALLHASISKPTVYPTWDEITVIKDLFFGDGMDAMMVMPKREDYVNVHKNCFQIWQTPIGWDVG